MTGAAALVVEGWGPERKAGAVSFTFDNLGEAAELEMGLWPANKAVGEHYSAREVVPTLLKRLETRTTVTFFAEGWNAEVYPETLRAIVAAGHEVGLHGWRHEIWSKQDETAQRVILRRSLEAMGALQIRPRGFRPPGGHATPLLDELIARHAMSYVSDVGTDASIADDVVHLPFQWRGVDGVFLEPELGKSLGVAGAEEVGLDALVRNHKAAMVKAKETGHHVVFVFHPFILGQDAARLEALFDLVEFACADRDLWPASCGMVAQWLLSTQGCVNLSN